ncbi:hypothetical protein H310_08419 [Aphanomyces invadans]|uniref:Uncharacterized protein n=1 Tax=Aphanomyces invadans TaxID=157072 RepID=A0A024U030_9STRA|nr:hypothetical protein H310_08419 [Aphanomyces invadans]ETV98932.1 hypothetical protein H310_08419 [Aphanomyces invadans]|eukprot:XP_008872360.1 hypothetical protein H310_08419 [Aphanomyces invadans]
MVAIKKGGVAAYVYGGNLGYADVSARKKGNCGRKRTTTLADVKASVKAADPYHRSTLRAGRVHMYIASTTLWRLVKTKKI